MTTPGGDPARGPGVTPASRREPVEHAIHDLEPRELEELLLEGPRLFSRSEVAEESGMDAERIRRLWRALGFPDVSEQEVAFTEADVAALRRVGRLVRRGVFDDEFALGVTRAMGHHLSRLVEWEYVALAEHLTVRDDLGPEEAGPAALATLAEHLMDLEGLLLYAWRRQLVATAGRVLAGRDGSVTTRERTVGFADLVSYTRLAQRLSERELARLVDRFESLSSDVIAGHGGRVVKTVGDEVLFLMPGPRAAADTALDLAETMAADSFVPDVRVGLASGLVLTRMGDVFGTVVNLASRLTAGARPGTVLVDPATAARLVGDDRFAVRQLRSRLIRGLGPVAPSVLSRGPRRPGDDRGPEEAAVGRAG